MRSLPVHKSVSASGLLMMALTLFMLPIQWIFAAIIAALFHELCHFFAVRLCGGQVTQITAGTSGANMTALGLSPWQALICTLAGPAGSLLLLLLARWFPRIALCGGLQGLYNLLPMYQLDGGKALRFITQMILPAEWTERICSTIQLLCLSGIIFLGFYGSFVLHLGLFPLLTASFVAIRGFQGKTPCKPPLNSVQ